MTEKGCINLYFHSYTFYMSYKLFSYLGSLSCFCPVNSSTPFLPISTRHKQWRIYLFLEKSLKNCCNNLYLHPNTINMSSKPLSYLVSISCCGAVNQSIPTVPNINLTKTMKKFTCCLENHWKKLQQSLFPS